MAEGLTGCLHVSAHCKYETSFADLIDPQPQLVMSATTRFQNAVNNIPVFVV